MSPADPKYLAHRERETALFEARARGDIPHRFKYQPQNGADTMLQTTEEPTPSATIMPPKARSRRVRVPAEVTINGGSPLPASASLLDVILHAGSDPRFDVEKFRALVQIQREEQDRQDARADREAAMEAEAAFWTAMSEVQRQMIAVRAKIENTQTRSMYADYAAMDAMLRPIYAPAGFALSYGEEDSPKPDHVRVFCLVTHTERSAKRSHVHKYHVDMPADGKGARGGDVMTKTHATMSGFTYGQRSLLKMIFNIAVTKDDDGNAAGAKPAEPPAELQGTISAAQAAEIKKLLDDRGIAHRAFLNYIRLPSIEHIGVEHFERAVAKIKSQGARS